MQQVCFIIINKSDKWNSRKKSSPFRVWSHVKAKNFLAATRHFMSECDYVVVFLFLYICELLRFIYVKRQDFTTVVAVVIIMLLWRHGGKRPHFCSVVKCAYGTIFSATLTMQHIAIFNRTWLYNAVQQYCRKLLTELSATLLYCIEQLINDQNKRANVVWKVYCSRIRVKRPSCCINEIEVQHLDEMTKVYS